MANNDFENLKRLGNAADTLIGTAFSGIGAVVITLVLLLLGAAAIRLIIWGFGNLFGAA